MQILFKNPPKKEKEKYLLSIFQIQPAWHKGQKTIEKQNARWGRMYPECFQLIVIHHAHHRLKQVILIEWWQLCSPMTCVGSWA
jgi:hypothetical protein